MQPRESLICLRDSLPLLRGGHAVTWSDSALPSVLLSALSAAAPKAEGEREGRKAEREKERAGLTAEQRGSMQETCPHNTRNRDQFSKASKGYTRRAGWAPETAQRGLIVLNTVLTVQHLPVEPTPCPLIPVLVKTPFLLPGSTGPTSILQWHIATHTFYYKETLCIGPISACFFSYYSWVENGFVCQKNWKNQKCFIFVLFFCSFFPLKTRFLIGHLEGLRFFDKP